MQNKITNPFSRLFQADTNDTDESSENQANHDNGHLAIDLYEKNNKYYVVTPIAGVQPEDIELELNEDFVIIKGNRRSETTQAKENYIFQECYWGTFSRQINFPSPIDPDQAEAAFKDGMLYITAPKVKSTQTRTLKIKTL